MTLHNFLKLHDGGTACVSIHQDQFGSKHKTYFEEEYQESILASEAYRTIKSCQVDRFCVIGGGSYPVELVVHIKP